jgi:hypothetical protein
MGLLGDARACKNAPGFQRGHCCKRVRALLNALVCVVCVVCVLVVGAWACTAGLRVGDVLVAVNGARVHTMAFADLIAALKAAPRPVTLTVLRRLTAAAPPPLNTALPLDAGISVGHARRLQAGDAVAHSPVPGSGGGGCPTVDTGVPPPPPPVPSGSQAPSRGPRRCASGNGIAWGVRHATPIGLLSPVVERGAPKLTTTCTTGGGGGDAAASHGSENSNPGGTLAVTPGRVGRAGEDGTWAPLALARRPIMIDTSVTVGVAAAASPGGPEWQPMSVTNRRRRQGTVAPMRPLGHTTMSPCSMALRRNGVVIDTVGCGVGVGGGKGWGWGLGWGWGWGCFECLRL